MVNFLLCFSVIKNTKAVLNTDVPKGSITAINGMRTLSITWVVLGHALAFAFQYIGRFEIHKMPAKELVFRILYWKSFLLEALNMLLTEKTSSKEKAFSERFCKFHQ